MNSNDKLTSPERIAAGLLVGLVFCLLILDLFISLSYSNRCEHSITEFQPYTTTITITVEGAVDNPGVYQVEKGTKLGDFFALLDIQEDANLRKFDLSKEMTRKRTIKIPKKKKVGRKSKNLSVTLPST